VAEVSHAVDRDRDGDEARDHHEPRGKRRHRVAEDDPGDFVAEESPLDRTSRRDHLNGDEGGECRGQNRAAHRREAASARAAGEGEGRGGRHRSKDDRRRHSHGNELHHAQLRHQTRSTRLTTRAIT
jgi:hypothetical protein